MNEEVINLKSGKVSDYLYHIDMRAFGAKRMLSIFLGVFDDCSVLIDSGSSLDVKKGLRFFKKNHISLSSFKYLITSHHHFDHNGGMWKMYEEIKNYNPNVKILTNLRTKALLNDFEYHLDRGRSTYGKFVGEMKPIEDMAFKIIDPSINFDSNPSKLDFIENFTLNRSEIKLVILKTPGHTPDHQTPIFIKDNRIDFIFLGEAAGTLYHDSKLLTMPTSMPVYYNHENYMNTLENIIKLNPLIAGFGHFGIVNGQKNVNKILLDHKNLMEKFKSLVIKYYEEKPETKYIVEKILPLFLPRTDLPYEGHPLFRNIALAVVYGMMLSLGLRSLPKNEKKFLKF